MQRSSWISNITLYPVFPIMNPQCQFVMLLSNIIPVTKQLKDLRLVNIHVVHMWSHAPQALRWWHIISHNAFANPDSGWDGCSAEWDLTGRGRNDSVCRGSLTLRGKVFALGVCVKSWAKHPDSCYVNVNLTPQKAYHIISS